MPECQKIIKGGLDQRGAEHFGRLIFATIRKKCGTERVKKTVSNISLTELLDPS